MTPPTGRRGRAALVALACLLSLLVPGVAGAAPRAALYADALRRDPLYVSPSAVRAFPPAERARIRRELARSPDTYVLAVPRFLDEPGATLPRDFLAQVQDRLGRDGVFVLVEPGSVGVDAQAAGVRPKGDADDVYRAVRNATGWRATDPERILAALRFLRTGVGDTAWHEGDSPSSRTEARDVVPWALFGGGALVAFAVPFAWWWRRTRPAAPPSRRRPGSVPISRPARDA
ncbi:hypothetical protein ACVU7I_16300, partial [Patulibacter sp. S7RM1-6]